MKDLIKKWENHLSEEKREDVYYTKELIEEMISQAKESLGIEVEPKDGEVYSCDTAIDNKMVFRYKNEPRKDVINRLEFNVYSSLLPYNDDFNYNNWVCVSNDDKHYSKATPEEEKQLIRAEHDSGYHWTGLDLVELEDQEAKKKEAAKVATSIFKSVADSFKIWRDFEKQMTSVKSISDNAYYIGLDLASKERDEMSINIIRTDPVTPLYDRIKDLEKENELFKCRIKELTDQCDEIYANNKPNIIINELNVEIETKDKRIAELEKNLIIMCELGNKVL